jgi:hypothetical protein
MQFMVLFNEIYNDSISLLNVICLNNFASGIGWYNIFSIMCVHVLFSILTSFLKTCEKFVKVYGNPDGTKIQTPNWMFTVAAGHVQSFVAIEFW